MAASTFPAAIAALLAHEGEYVDRADDPGGATNMGITLRTLAVWRARPVTKAEVRALTRDEAVRIYRAMYWDAIKGDALPPGIDYATFDACVLAGPRRAAEWLQTAAGVKADGAIGPITLRVIAAEHVPARLINAALNLRLAYLRTRPHWPAYRIGWSRRVTDVRRLAIDLATR